MNKTIKFLITLLAIVLVSGYSFSQESGDLNEGWPVINHPVVGLHNHLPGGDFRGLTEVYVWGPATRLPMSWTNQESSSDAVANTAGDVTATTAHARLTFPIGVQDYKSCIIQIWDVSESNHIGTVADDAAGVPSSAGSTIPMVSSVTGTISNGEGGLPDVEFRVLGSLVITGASASSQSGGVMNFGAADNMPAIELPLESMNYDEWREVTVGAFGALGSATSSRKFPYVTRSATRAGMYKVDVDGLNWINLYGKNTNRATYVTVVKKIPR